MARRRRAPDSTGPSYALRTATGHSIAVDGNRFAAATRPASFAIDLGDGELRPGLINAHDHLFLNHFPRLGAPPYANLYAWADDVQGRLAADVRRYRALPLREALLFGALKNLIGGVTAVVHHDTWSPELRSLPIRVVRVRVVHSLGLERDLEAASRAAGTPRGRPLCLHLAEGTDARAAAETADADRLGLLSPGTLAVHAIAVDRAAVERLCRSGAAVVWCPTSNLHLYGGTLRAELARSGIDVLIGTDSLLSGAGTLLDELGAARRCGLLNSDQLLDAVGATAARRLRIPPPSLRPGGRADLCFLRRPVLDASAGDVGLVVVDGMPRYGDAELRELFDRTGVEVEEITVGGRAKLVQAPLGEVARRVIDLSPTCARIFDA